MLNRRGSFQGRCDGFQVLDSSFPLSLRRVASPRPGRFARLAALLTRPLRGLVAVLTPEDSRRSSPEPSFASLTRTSPGFVLRTGRGRLSRAIASLRSARCRPIAVPPSGCQGCRRYPSSRISENSHLPGQSVLLLAGFVLGLAVALHGREFFDCFQRANRVVEEAQDVALVGVEHVVIAHHVYDGRRPEA